MKSFATRLPILAATLILSAGLFWPIDGRADDSNLKTYIQVNQPFQVPGAELQANTRYVLKRLDHGTTDPHILQVLTADERHVLSTFYAASAERLKPTGKTVMTFYETAEGYSRPVHKWFYPGRLIGYDFIYPEAKMSEITAHLIGTKPEVQTAQFEKSEAPEANTEATNTTTANENENLMAESSAQEIQPEKPADTSNTANSTSVTDTDTAQEAAADTSAQNAAPTELPRTAGELPLLLLAGLACFAIRRFA